MPFNIASWIAASAFIAYILIASIRSKTISYSPLFLYCLIFPITIMLAGALSEVSEPIVWLFRQLFILGGILFLLALFQFRWTQLQVEKILYYSVFAMSLHVMVGLIQVFDVAIVQNKIPLSGRGQPPFGIFQQVNLLATYLVTGTLIILFLISRPSFSSTRLITKLLMAIVFGVALYVILSTGSRIGLLSLLIGGSIMLISRRKQLSRQKFMFILLVISSSLGVIASTTDVLKSPTRELHGQSGIELVTKKVEKLAGGKYQSFRQSMYAISIEIILQKPLLGHGIGSFPRVWAEQKAKFTQQNPNAVVSHLTTGHPHNEVLLWLIEGGIVAALGLAIIVIVIGISLYSCGFSRGGAYLALLVPISLHTQVALPFYGSAVHWFLWLFIIFMLFRHRLEIISFKMSQSGQYLVQLSLVLITVVSIYFLMHTKQAHDHIFMYLDDQEIRANSNMQLALDNIYFSRYAEKLMMHRMLNISIHRNNKKFVPTFIIWAEERIKSNPELGMFLLLSYAYNFMGDFENSCRVANNGLPIYPGNKDLQIMVASCQREN